MTLVAGKAALYEKKDEERYWRMFHYRGQPVQEVSLRQGGCWPPMGALLVRMD
jgi:hypothetical protein